MQSNRSTPNRAVSVHPSEWRNYAGDPPDLRRTPLGYVRLLWNELTRYCCEVCQRCGRRVGAATGAWWSADDALWIEVMTHDGGVLCPRCFTEACGRRGIFIYWKPVIDSRRPLHGSEQT